MHTKWNFFKEPEHSPAPVPQRLQARVRRGTTGVVASESPRQRSELMQGLSAVSFACSMCENI